MQWGMVLRGRNEMKCLSERMSPELKFLFVIVMTLGHCSKYGGVLSKKSLDLGYA